MNTNKNKNELIQCPFCKEKVKKGALKCKHCNESLKDILGDKKLCPFCKEKININATKCKYCKTYLQNTIEHKMQKSSKKSWMGITALIIGIIIFLIVISTQENDFDKETIEGALTLAILGIGFGIPAIISNNGKKPGITGLILSIIAFLYSLDIYSKF